MSLRQSLGILLLLVALACAPAAFAADEKLVQEHWYELLMDRVKAGWMSELVYDDGAQYRTVVETTLKVKRGEAPMTVTMNSYFVETHEGRAVEVGCIQRASLQNVQMRWRFGPGHVEQTIMQGGAETTSPLRHPDGIWLMPAAADRFAQERRAAGAREFTYRTLEPESQGINPVTVKCTRAGDEEYVDPSGRKLPVSVWMVESDAMAGVTAKEFYSSDGHLVYQEVAMGTGFIVARIAEREVALALDADRVPDLFASTFVAADRRLRRADSLSRARFRLRLTGGPMPAVPSAGAQRAEPAEDGSVLLTIDIDQSLRAPRDEAENGEFLAASSMVNRDDPLVRKLAESAVRDGPADPFRRAEALRRLVQTHISRKGFETAFASAAETARTRQGDCSEHAVLLCALLRSQEIPSRVATGLLYVDDYAGQEHVFGWHMWTQALLDGCWVDFDATLLRRYHAAHILTSVSSLADHAGSGDVAGMMQMIGRLKVEVLEEDATE